VNDTLIQSGPATPDLDAVVTEYLKALEAGEAPDRDEWLARHPTLADELAEFFADLDGVDQLARPLRQIAAPVSGEVHGTLGDFRIMREVGRGGMGVVYEAEQMSLGRRVALKVLPFAATMDQKQLQRFKNEARAAAGLHHEHIVPVHGVGCERGVHYYAMQFIDGQTLAEVIAEQRGSSKAVEKGSKGEGEKAAANCPAPPLPSSPAPTSETSPIAAISTKKGKSPFRRIAEIIAQAADALEYAHSMGVVHRDVKPANLLMDDAGKIWVTDFGLARFGADAGLTVSGDLLGTLRYMSPEQALAKHGLVDHRTDVYSLGATLYELLTRRPAVDGADKQEVLHNIAFADPAPPRKFDKSIPAELETVTLKALAKDPAQRYATAQELADDLKRFLNDEPVRAKRPTPGQRAAKWARRHRAMVLVVTAMLALGVLGLGVSLLFILQAYRAETEQRRQAVAKKELARSIVDEMYTEIAEEWYSRLPHMTEVRRHFLLKALKQYEQFAEDDATDPRDRQGKGKAFKRVGDIQFLLGNHAEAEKAHWEAIGIFERLVGDCPGEPPYRADLASAHISLGNLLERTQRPDQAEQAYGQAQGLLQRLTEESPGTADYRLALAICRNAIADSLRARGRYEDAERIFLQGASDLGSLASDGRPNPKARQALAVIYNNLGALYEGRGRLADATNSYHESLRLKSTLIRLLPSPDVQQSLANSYINLSRALKEQGRFADAEDACRKALGAYVDLHAEYPTMPGFRHDLAKAHILLGNLLWRNKAQLLDAEKEYHESSALLGKLVEEFPDVPRYRADLANAAGNLADMCKDTGRPKDAEQYYFQAIQHLRELVSKFPDAPAHREKLSTVLYNFVDFLVLGRQYQKAEEVCEEALAHRRQLVARFPDNPQHQSNLATTYFRLGVVFYSTQRLTRAEECIREAMKLADDLEAHSRLPQGNAWLPSACLANLGAVQSSTGRLKEAEESWRQAVPRFERLAEMFPKRAECHSQLATMCQNLGVLLHDRGELAEARTFLEQAVSRQSRAVQLNPRNVSYRRLLAQHDEKLATTLIRLGEHAAAAQAASETIHLSSESADQHYNVGCLLAQCAALADKDSRLSAEKRKELAQSYADRAVEMLREAIRVGFQDAKHMKNDPDLDPLRLRDDFKKLVSELEAKKK
jgi:eukaryotic-like serine/threonine-protein kinase